MLAEYLAIYVIPVGPFHSVSCRVSPNIRLARHFVHGRVVNFFSEFFFFRSIDVELNEEGKAERG